MITETRQYITFKFGDELFAVDVAQVRKAVEVLRIIKALSAPGHVRRVANVRGQAIPVLDPRLRFGFPRAGRSIKLPASSSASLDGGHISNLGGFPGVGGFACVSICRSTPPLPISKPKGTNE